MRNQFLSIFLICLISIAPLASSESNSDFTVDNKEPEMTTGDYFLYDLDMTGMLDSMEDEDIDEVLESAASLEYLEHFFNQIDELGLPYLLMSDLGK